MNKRKTGGEKGDDWVAASAADARIHIEKKKKSVVVVCNAL